MNETQLFIQRCFELARLGSGSVSPNPRVGAVIARDGKILGEGFHAVAGGPHAEINAINTLKDKNDLHDSTLYVSLEPCNNFGKTPPCVDSVLRYRIPRVVLSSIDPNPKTKGKSIEKLKAAGVSVHKNVLEEKGKRITEGFFKSFEKKRPFVLLKFARTCNNKMGIAHQNIQISNPYTKRLTHKWRSECNAIMVGSGTILADNPQLDNRFYFGNSPVKVLLKRDGLLPSSLAAFHSKGRVIVISEKATLKKNDPKISQWVLPFDKKLLPNILELLRKEGILSLMVEGGATLINHFIDQQLWDEARIFIAPKPIDHPAAIQAPDPGGHLESTQIIDDNILQVFRNT